MKADEMTEKIDMDQLSQKFIDLWQGQLEKALSDPLLQKSSYEMMSQFQEMMKNNVSKAASNFTQSDKPEENTCAAATPADDIPVADVMGCLVERVTACEKRLEQLESFFRSFQSKAS
jgi:hypothetical protein